MNEKQWIEQLTKEGYKNVAVCPNGPNTEFPEHTHEQQTAHVILTGELMLVGKDGMKTMKLGERFDIPAGTTHTATCGPDGCTFVVGFKD